MYAVVHILFNVKYCSGLKWLLYTTLQSFLLFVKKNNNKIYIIRLLDIPVILSDKVTTLILPAGQTPQTDVLAIAREWCNKCKFTWNKILNLINMKINVNPLSASDRLYRLEKNFFKDFNWRPMWMKRIY